MVFDRFLSFTKSRRFLKLSKASEKEAIVPHLRDVNIKTTVRISSESLLQYQHDLRTNSGFFSIDLKLNPANEDISALQQFFIVNGLHDEFLLELDYDSSIVSAATGDRQREKLLVEYAENLCNKKIARELRIAEKLLNAGDTRYFECVAKRVDAIFENAITPEMIESGELPLAEKSSVVHLEWFSIVRPCIEGLVEKASIDSSKFSLESPFELIDLDKVRVLGTLLGHIYEGQSPWVSHVVHTRKYRIGSVAICPSRKVTEERIKRCLAHCAASFFDKVSRQPLGGKFQEAASEPLERYVEATKDFFKLVESIGRKNQVASAKKAKSNALLLVDKLGSEAERLKLAMEHDLDYTDIYYDTLTSYLRQEIESDLCRSLVELYDCSNVDLASSINFSDGLFLQQANSSEITSPQLLTLRVSQILKKYFESHPWLSRLGFRIPVVHLLSARASNFGGIDMTPGDEIIVLTRYFPSGYSTKSSELVININKISFDLQQAGEMVKLHRM